MENVSKRNFEEELKELNELRKEYMKKSFIISLQIKELKIHMEDLEEVKKYVKK